jgi:hypothetical protein
MGPPFGGAGEITEPVPFEGMSGTNATVPVSSDQPPPQRPQADEAILRAWEPPPGTPPQTGIQSVSENVCSPQSAGVEATVIRATPEPSASVGTPEGAIIIPGEGTLTADAERAPAKSAE